MYGETVYYRVSGYLHAGQDDSVVCTVPTAQWIVVAVANVMFVLQTAEVLIVPRIQYNFLKPFIENNAVLLAADT